MEIVSPKIRPIFCPKLGEEQKKKGLHSNFGQIFCPNLGEEQKTKKGHHSNLVQLLAKLESKPETNVPSRLIV